MAREHAPEAVERSLAISAINLLSGSQGPLSFLDTDLTAEATGIRPSEILVLSTSRWQMHLEEKKALFEGSVVTPLDWIAQ